jgi:hypothetical protein
VSSQRHPWAPGSFLLPRPKLQRSGYHLPLNLLSFLFYFFSHTYLLLIFSDSSGAAFGSSELNVNCPSLLCLSYPSCYPLPSHFSALLADIYLVFYITVLFSLFSPKSSWVFTFKFPRPAI